MEVIKILKKLVSYNTIEDKQNKEIIEWIKMYLGRYGFKCKTIMDKNTKKRCLIAQIGKNPILAFSGHLDTVNATDEWNSNPFKMKIENGKAYGLGVCDMKGGIAAVLRACSSIDKKKLKHGLKLFFTFDEEINFGGIKLLCESKEEIPKYLILAEPTDLKPVVATKGCMEMKVTFNGKSSHSSMPENGKNAIIEAHKFINELLELAEKLKVEKNDLFSVPYTTINIGVINGGDAINKVPDKCVLKFDARTINKNHNVIIENEVKKILEKYDCKLEIENNIYANINEDNKMISIIKKIAREDKQAENYVTEASFIKSESVVIGPGPITAHQANEYIEIQKLKQLVKIYIKIIQKYCF